MKSLVLIILALTLVSCSTVRFNEPPPKKGERLNTLPEELQGVWTGDNGERIYYYDSCSMSENFITDTLDNVIDTSYSYTYLSDSIRLYKHENYYLYNEQFDDGSWRFMLAHLDDSGNISNYFCDEFEFYTRFRGLKIDSAIVIAYDYFPEIDEVREYDTVLVKPKLKHLQEDRFENLQRIYFSGQIRVKDLKKIMIKETLLYIQKSDGTIFSPEVEEAEETESEEVPEK